MMNEVPFFIASIFINIFSTILTGMRKNTHSNEKRFPLV